MNLIHWLTGLLSPRGKALAHYRSGMAKAKKGDFARAVLDYSAAIRSPKIPNDVKGMAYYNRALAYSAIHEDTKAAEDLAVVLEMPGLPQNIKVAAEQRRERIRRRNQDADKV